MADKYRILIVDDHAVFREGLALIINREKDLEVCGEADDISSALDAADRLKPDMIIIDIILKKGSGIELLKDLRRTGCKAPCLMLSMHEESLYAGRAIKAGARGYIMKHETAHELSRAISRIRTGRIYLSSRMTANVLDSLSDSPGGPVVSLVDNLSDRELQVLEMIGQGIITREIARNLSLSSKTIGTYREKIKQKLKLENAAELNKFAYEWFVNQKEPSAD